MYGNSTGYPSQQPQPLNIPADPNRLTYPWLQFNFPNPPHVPNLNVPPPLQPHYPHIVAMVLHQTQEQAERNPLRRVFFNLLAPNEFRNQQFADLVEVAVLFLDMEMRANKFRTIEDGIAQCIPWVIDRAVAGNVHYWPDLMRFVEPQYQAQVQQMCGEFHNGILRTIQQGMQPVQQQGYGVTSNPPPVQRTGYQGGGHSPVIEMDPSLGSKRRQDRAQEQQTVQRGYTEQTTGNHRIDRHASVTPAIEEEIRMSGSKMVVVKEADDGSTPQYGTQPIQGRVQQARVSDVRYHDRDENGVVVEVLDDNTVPRLESDANHHRTPEQPYPLAHHPTHQTLFHVIQEDGTATHLIKDKPSYNAMNYDDHELSVTFGKPPAAQIFGRADAALDRIGEGVSQLDTSPVYPAERDLGELGEELVDELTKSVRDGWSLETSLTEAWFSAVLARSPISDEIPDVFMAFSKIATPIVVETNQQANLKLLASSPDLATLAGRLNSMKDEMGDALWYALNKHFTETINAVLERNLSFKFLKITHFSDDAADLIPYLEKHYGSATALGLIKNEASLVAALTNHMNADETQSYSKLLAGYRSVDPETMPELAVVLKDVSITLLNALCYDLDLELQAGVGAAVMESSMPVMHALLRTIFEKTDEMLAASDGKLLHHYLITTDGRIMEATRGFLGKDYYLLTLID